MGNINVAVLGPEGYGKELGKPGTASDITFYNLKKGNDTVTFVEPSRYPERLAPLYYAVSMSGYAILVVEEIGPLFGEEVLMLEAAGVQKGYIILRNFIAPEQIAPLIRGTVLEQYAVVPDDRRSLREQLLAKAAVAGESPPPENAPAVGTAVVDHAFNVKGIGTVALGCVAEGYIRRHETLQVLPSGKTAQVRSIQKHDDDFEWAGAGDRVGLALKGVDVGEVERGSVLTTDSSIRAVTELTAPAALVKYWPAPLRPGMVLHLGHWMQFEFARVTGVDDSTGWRSPMLTLALDKPLIYRPGSRAILHYLEGGKLRIAGTVLLRT